MNVGQEIDELLQSTSDVLFPAELGEANIALDSVGCDGDTPLHVLIWRNDTRGAVSLIEAGAPVNVAGDMSETPLHVAYRKLNQSIADALISAGADPDVKSEFGQTPREVAHAEGLRVGSNT